MILSELIDPSSVKFLHGVTSKKRLFQSVASVAAPHCQIQQDVIVHALINREDLGATGVGNGVALPHARLEGLDRIIGCFIRLDRPVDYNAVDRQPVDLVFSLFAPMEGGVAHLKALAAVSRTLRNTEVREKLRSNEDPNTLYEVLLGASQTSAAA
ncbi:MAG: PTS sugar transporter subunit IIA [Pseudomonadota bacterium]